MMGRTSDLFYFTSKKMGKAIWDYGMLKEGDDVLVAVSGGKDSLVLLKIMKERMTFVPIKYSITACHVDMGFQWADKDALTRYFEEESIPYIIARPPPEWSARDNTNCFWCSWNRRKALFSAAREGGFNRIALAHHMDDIIETILMNLFFNGEIATMTPCQEMFGGEVTIIRPMAYVEEKDIAGLAESLHMPVAISQCPRGDISKRRLVKGIVAEMERHNRNVKKNIFRSLGKIREEQLLHHASP